nr:MAG TPA: hypothetical protein [Caudoviricetes sp.]
METPIKSATSFCVILHALFIKLNNYNTYNN